MDVFEAIEGRRSVRKYKSKPVERELTEKLLNAACWAPSGGNIQPWKFIVVEDRMILEMVRKISPGYFGDTFLAILVCSDKMKAHRVEVYSGVTTFQSQTAQWPPKTYSWPRMRWDWVRAS